MTTTDTYRLITSNLFTRVSVKTKGTILDLKNEIEKITKVPVKQQKLFLDHKYTKKINLADNKLVSALGLKIGDAIYLSNSNAQSEYTEKKPEGKCNHGENEVCINCMSKHQKVEEKKVGKSGKPIMSNEDFRKKEGLTENCTHPPGQKCLYCMPKTTEEEEKKKKPLCNHPEGGKCPNCVDAGLISDAKHISFDQLINDRQQVCKGTHESSSVCVNCMPPAQISYLKKKGCTNHPEDFCCIKCMPPNAVLNRQKYRHVDFVSFENQYEIEQFLKPWTNKNFFPQRMGYLFGYYAKDPNYNKGVRAVVEYLYEPPQIGDQSAVMPQPDQEAGIIDRIAESLGLECIGWIFTTMKEEGIALTSYEIRKAAKLQQAYMIKHKSGCMISRFVTCAVKPTETGDAEIECYMVSDMCQALERDNIFSNLKDKKNMEIRKPKKGEMLPTVYMEGKPSNKFDPDFFVVNVAHGVPQKGKNFNVLKSYDFPSKANSPKGIVTENLVRDYFKKHKKDPPNYKCASFNFLIFVAKTVDIETAVSVGNSLQKGIVNWDVLKALMQKYVGE